MALTRAEIDGIAQLLRARGALPDRFTYQPRHNSLSALSEVVVDADQVLYFTSDMTAAAADFTSFARDVLAGADAPTVRTTLGLGSVENKSSATIRGELTGGNVTAALGFTPANVATVGAAGGIASLDGTGKVPAVQLPAFVDDVLEYANLAALPVAGTGGVIYITLDTGRAYRWSGSAYAEIPPSPGSTDVVVEGSTNLYFTTARVLATLLAGLSTATNAVIVAGDTVLSALGKLQKQLTDLTTTVAGKQATLVSATNIKTINGSSLLGAGDLVVGGGSGSGDVVGPAVAADSRVVMFDGTTGKLIKDSGVTLSGANTGDETAATIKTKLGIATLSGSNTGDQTTVTGNAGTATALQTARNIDGQSFNGTADITVVAPATVAAVSKATPVDADVMPIADSAAANVLKKLTWTNLKATLKTYFDTLYQATGSYLSSGGALGTPSSGTLTNCTGLPIGAGVSGLAAGVAAFLAAPSSANMAAMITDETGTGSNVFGTNPTLTNPVLAGAVYVQQGAPASLAAAATLTAAQMLGGIIQYTGAAAALTLPTGTLMDAAVVAGLAVDRAFEICFVNTGTGAATITAGVGFTIVGAAAVTNATSARYRCRRTAANTFVAYRVG